MDIRFRSTAFQSLSAAIDSVAQKKQETPSEVSRVSDAIQAVAQNRVTTLSPSVDYAKKYGTDFTSLVRQSIGAALIKPPFDFGKIFDSPLFVQGSGDTNSVAMNDVDQGTLRNCWMMAPLAELAQKDPEAIKRMIQKNADGTYTVTFKEKIPTPFGNLIVDRKVTVTADFPGGKNGADHAQPGDKNALGQGEIWPLIIEKAYAQYKGGYDKINANGNAGQFMEAITGRSSTEYAPLSIFGIGYGFNRMRDDFNSGKTMTMLSRDTVSGKYGVVKDHYYAVQSVYTDANGKQMVQLYNPWGNTQPQPIPYDELLAQFENVTVN
ncbi:MAG TPA: C2 family cysteine protease [Acidobacteriota bacterium]|nr:C2 family cysteine protease [Acidobacteriota bacterium]